MSGRGDRRCPDCGWHLFHHKHDEAHGLAGTHMAGSERFECTKCGRVIRPAEGEPLGFEFMLDFTRPTDE